MKINFDVSRSRFLEMLTVFITIGIALFSGYYSVTNPSRVLLLIVTLVTAISLLGQWNNLILLIIITGSVISFSPFSLFGTVFIADYFLILLFAWLVFIHHKRFTISSKLPLLAWMLFFIILLANFFRNPKLPQILGGDGLSDGIGLSYLLRGLSLVCGYLLGPVIFQNNDQLKRFFQGLAFVFMIALGFAWAYYLWGAPSVFVPGYSGNVFISNTEFGTVIRFGWIGTYASYLLPIVLAFFSDRRWLLKLGLVLFLFVSTVISGGRAQIITFAVVLVVFVYLRSHKFILVVVGTGGLVAFYLIIFALGINNIYPQLNRFAPVFTISQFTERSDGYSTSRLGVYEASFPLIQSNPFFGVGPPTDADIESSLYTYANDGVAHAREGTHATFVNIAAILGIPALLIFFTALIYTFRKTVRLYWRVPTRFERNVTEFILFVMISTLVIYLTSGSSNGGNLYFYFMLGLVEVLAAWQVAAAKSKSGLLQPDSL